MKQLFLATTCLFAALLGQAQNADPVVNIHTSDDTLFVGNTTTVNVDAGNFGANGIAAASLELTIRAGGASELTGIPDLDGTKWTLHATSTGAQNTYIFRNSAAFDADFDISSFELTVLAHSVSASDDVTAEISYIPGPNPNIAGNPESLVQGNGATDNDMSSTTLAITLPSPPLPLELRSFSGDMVNCQARLRWEAFDDVELPYYEVQQSSDGRNFTTVAHVASRRSTETERYTLTVPNPGNGTRYFRLKMKTVAGSVRYSSSVALRNACAATIVQIYPNPASSVVQVRGAAAGSIVRIYNYAGQLVRQGTVIAGVLTIPVADLPAGAYQLLVDDGQQVRHSFLKTAK